MSSLLSLPPWPPCQVDPERVSQKGVLGSASTAPCLWGQGWVAGSGHLASQGKAHCPSPGTLAAGPQHMPENATKTARKSSKADHTLHKTDPPLPPSPVPAAEPRPRPPKGPVCPGLAYPAPSSSPLPHAKHAS